MDQSSTQQDPKPDTVSAIPNTGTGTGTGTGTSISATTSSVPSIPDSSSTPQSLFHQTFQSKQTALKNQISTLKDTSPPERAATIDECLAEIARLSDDLGRAVGYLPAFERRVYVEALKSLRQDLDDTRASLAPKRKFAFKKKSPSATTATSSSEISLSPAEIQTQTQTTSEPFALQSRRIPTTTNSKHSSAPNTQEASSSALSLPPTTSLSLSSSRTPAQLSSRSIAFSSISHTHITLPLPTQSHPLPPIVLNSLSNTLIHTPFPLALPLLLSAPSPSPPSQSSLSPTSPSPPPSSPSPTLLPSSPSPPPYGTLTTHTLTKSLIICLPIAGAAHITAAQNCTFVLSARQIRLHDCRDCTLYLQCGGRPIIENCTGIRVAPIPGVFESASSVQNSSVQNSSPNQWNQVDDFQWLKPGQQSPNWRALEPEERVREEVWRWVLAEVEAEALGDGARDGDGDGGEEEKEKEKEKEKVEGILRAVGIRD